MRQSPTRQLNHTRRACDDQQTVWPRRDIASPSTTTPLKSAIKKLLPDEFVLEAGRPFAAGGAEGQGARRVAAEVHVDREDPLEPDQHDGVVEDFPAPDGWAAAAISVPANASTPVYLEGPGLLLFLLVDPGCPGEGSLQELAAGTAAGRGQLFEPRPSCLDFRDDDRIDVAGLLTLGEVEIFGKFLQGASGFLTKLPKHRKIRRRSSNESKRRRRMAWNLDWMCMQVTDFTMKTLNLSRQSLESWNSISVIRSLREPCLTGCQLQSLK